MNRRHLLSLPGKGRPAVLLAVLGAVLLLGASAPASAQRRGQDPDSAGAFLSVLSPSYNTVYNVNRQTTDWNQDFAFGSQFRFLNFNNKTNFDVKTDNGRDEERRNGSNQTVLRFTMIKKLPITSNMNFGRSSVVRPGDERESDDASINFTTTYGLGLLGIRHSFNGSGGYTHRKDISVRNELRSQSKDSGVSGNVTWRANWAYRFLTLSTNYRETRSSKTTELTQEDGSPDKRPTRNTNRTYGFTVNANPLSWVRGDVTLNNVSGNDEFFILQGGTGSLEQKVNRNRSVRAGLSLSPSDRLRTDWKITTTNHDLSYQVRRDIASSGNGLSWEGGLNTDFLGIKFDGTLSSKKDILEPATSSGTETRNNLFDGKLSRTLSSKISARLNYLVRATQIFFSDEDPSRILDRDELRTKFQPSLSYTPNPKWKVGATYILSTNRRVELNPTRTSQTQESEDYSVDINIAYKLSEKTNVSQNYSIEAEYTTFDFSRRADRLLSTQRIVTSVRSDVTPKVNLVMEHRFTLQDSGPFRFEDDGTRVFTRNLRKYRQELSTSIRYSVAPWLTLTTHSRFLRTDDVVEATGSRNITRDLNMQEGIQIRHSIGGATFSASGQYVQSSVRESYWTIRSDLTKEF